MKRRKVITNRIIDFEYNAIQYNEYMKKKARAYNFEKYRVDTDNYDRTDSEKSKNSKNSGNQNQLFDKKNIYQSSVTYFDKDQKKKKILRRAMGVMEKGRHEGFKEKMRLEKEKIELKK